MRIILNIRYLVKFNVDGYLEKEVSLSARENIWNETVRLTNQRPIRRQILNALEDLTMLVNKES